MDHDKEDALNDMLGVGDIPASLMVSSQQNTKLSIPTRSANYGALLDNETNLFEGLISHDGINNGFISSQLASSRLQLPMDSLKRTLPSINWTDEDAAAGASLSKRFHGESNDDLSIRRTDGNGSIATLLSHLPQTPPPLHQQTVLGSSGDVLFRQPYHQLPGMNWYS